MDKRQMAVVVSGLVLIGACPAVRTWPSRAVRRPRTRRRPVPARTAPSRVTRAARTWPATPSRPSRPRARRASSRRPGGPRSPVTRSFPEAGTPSRRGRTPTTSSRAWSNTPWAETGSGRAPPIPATGSRPPTGVVTRSRLVCPATRVASVWLPSSAQRVHGLCGGEHREQPRPQSANANNKTQSEAIIEHRPLAPQGRHGRRWAGARG
jgi:hypothetical protein